MLPVADISVGIAGAARLARFDLEGFEYFDNSIHGFWQSFYAAVVIAPLFLILILIQYLTTEGGGPFLHYLIIEGLAYFIAWPAFPLILLFVLVSPGPRDELHPLFRRLQLDCRYPKHRLHAARCFRYYRRIST